jgi:hypothetical protein
MPKNPMNDDDYTGNDEQIDDLKSLVEDLTETLSETAQALSGWMNTAGAVDDKRHDGDALLEKATALIAKVNTPGNDAEKH